MRLYIDILKSSFRSYWNN